MVRTKEELTRYLSENQWLYSVWRDRLKRLHHGTGAADKPPQPTEPDKANWHGIATMNGGRRFQIGLKGTSGCEYGQCLNCFLYHGASCATITADNIVAQLKNAMRSDGLLSVASDSASVWEDARMSDVDRIDFNGSGSFLNDNEMPHEARTALFRHLTTTPFQAVLIESRIEYVNIRQVLELRHILRPDQALMVAIGLESADDVIREMAIGKGYHLSDFEVCVQALAKIGVDVLVYSLVKPAFITEAEALGDSINTGRYLARLADRINGATDGSAFELVMKLEPAFIQKDGFLDFLRELSTHAESDSEPPLYETPWSFTVAEIVRRLIDEGIAGRINLQIGRSDDFPPPIDVTRNRDDPEDLREKLGAGSSARIDDALQRYNVGHDAHRLKSEILSVSQDYPRTHAAWIALVS